MSFNISYPNFTGSTAIDQLSEIKSYLFSLTTSLNDALQSLPIDSPYDVTYTVSSNSAGSKTPQQRKAEATFGEIRDLIINSAEIFSAYSEAIQKSLNYNYVAKSDYGTYIDKAFSQIEATAKKITDVITETQTEETEGGIRTVNINGFIEAGIIDEVDGIGVIGVAIGQTTTDDGVETFHKAVQLTAEKLSFIDQNGTEVAYLSGSTLKITKCEILDFLRLGDYDVDVSYGVAWKWRGN